MVLGGFRSFHVLVTTKSSLMIRPASNLFLARKIYKAQLRVRRSPELCCFGKSTEPSFTGRRLTLSGMS